MMTVEPAGYSGRTLAAKLGLRDGLSVLPLNPPGDYEALTGAAAVGAVVVTSGPAGLVHLFVADKESLARDLPAAIAALLPGAALWISWPKKASPLFRGLTEDGVRDRVLPTGWVDVKVCAVDAVWSGLKFLKRRG